MLHEIQLESDGVTLNLTEGPRAGPPLLLLHGVARALAGLCRADSDAGRALARSGVSIFAVMGDRRGPHPIGSLTTCAMP